MATINHLCHELLIKILYFACLDLISTYEQLTADPEISLIKAKQSGLVWHGEHRGGPVVLRNFARLALVQHRFYRAIASHVRIDEKHPAQILQLLQAKFVQQIMSIDKLPDTWNSIILLA